MDGDDVIKKVIINQSGFGLVGVLASAAAGIVVLMGLTQTQMALLQGNRKIELKMNALELIKEVVQTLEAPPPDCEPPCTWSKSSCTNTLSGFTDISGREVEKTAILDVSSSVSPSAPAVYSTGTSYGGVYLKKIKVIAGSTGDRIVTVRIWFETEEDRQRGMVSPEMSRPFDVFVRVNYESAGSNKVESCEAVVTNLSHFSGKSCPDNQYLKGFDEYGIMMCEISQRNQECPAGEELSGFDSDGNMVCVPRCPTGEYLSGLDVSGNKICKISHSDQVCPSGKYLRGFDSSGQKLCETPPSPDPPECLSGYWSEPCQMCGSMCGRYQFLTLGNCPQDNGDAWDDAYCACRWCGDTQ